MPLKTPSESIIKNAKCPYYRHLPGGMGSFRERKPCPNKYDHRVESFLTDAFVSTIRATGDATLGYQDKDVYEHATEAVVWLGLS
jgi:hypothetical protein